MHFLSATLVGVVVAFAAIFIGPFFTAPGYSIITHTTSELGAQNTPNAWIMNLGFLAFGFGVIFDAIRRLRDIPIGAFAFIVFGISMILTAVFSNRPIDPSVTYNVFHDYLHSTFSSAVAVSFAVGSLSFTFVERGTLRKGMCILAAIISVLISLEMAMLPEYAGALQRLMFTISFIWLVVFLPKAPEPRLGS